MCVCVCANLTLLPQYMYLQNNYWKAQAEAFLLDV